MHAVFICLFLDQDIRDINHPTMANALGEWDSYMNSHTI